MQTRDFHLEVIWLEFEDRHVDMWSKRVARLYWALFNYDNFAFVVKITEVRDHDDKQLSTILSAIMSVALKIALIRMNMTLLAF